MPLNDIDDPKAVRRAIDEFRLIGQARFLKKYGFGASRGWMLRDDDGHEFDAKAVLDDGKDSCGILTQEPLTRVLGLGDGRRQAD